MLTTRLGFFGGGLIASYHAAMLQRSQVDASIVAVHDPDRSRAEAFAAANGAEVVATEEALLDAVDAVYVCSWTAEHPRLVAAAAARGLPVFCEKPLATGLDGARGMVEEVTRAGVVNQVGLVLRDSPAMLWLRHLVQRAESGRVMSIVFRDDQYIPIQGMYGSTWRGDRAKAGSGALLEHSIHDVDLLEWIAGPVVEVAGRTATFHGIDGIEDAVTAWLAFDSGALASLTSVWHDVLARPSMRHMEVFCENAYYVLEGDVFGPVRATGPGGHESCLEGGALMDALRDHGVAVRNPDEEFVRCARTGAPATPDFACASRAHVLVDAIYRSAACGGAAVAISSSDT